MKTENICGTGGTTFFGGTAYVTFFYRVTNANIHQRNCNQLLITAPHL